MGRGHGHSSVVDPATVAGVQTVFSRSRLSHRNWQSRLMEGRVDARYAHRTSRGAVDIFRDRRAPSPTKVNVWLLVDASGSMGGPKAESAQDITATLAEAFKRIQSVSLHVWQHDFPYLSDPTVRLFRIYEPGMSLAKIETMSTNGMTGNADGFALGEIGKFAKRKHRPGDRDIIIVISDGEPTDHGKGATNRDLLSHSATIAEDIRRDGTQVLCVAIEHSTSYAYAMYGEENVVPFKYGSPTAWNDLARGLADIFGRVLR